MKIVIYEDHTWDKFYPITLNHPVYQLKCGIYSFSKKIKELFHQYKCLYFARNEIQNAFPEDSYLNLDNLEEDEYLFINASVIPDQCWELDANQTGIIDDQIISFRIHKKDLAQLKQIDFFTEENLKLFFKQKNFTQKIINGKQFQYLYELVNENYNEIIHDSVHVDLKLFQKNPIPIDKSGHGDIFLHPTAKVYPGSYFISENGPIIIDERAVIKPLSIIEGPCYIGRDTQVNSAKIRGGTSIFHTCKVSGEIENSIILSYTNKNHDGFLGHSYIGSYVNFGALSTNSDLKNNYREVTLNYLNKQIKTNSIKIGCYIGDHTKLGIASLINTGTVIGMACNLFFEGEMYPKNIPSFSWGGKILNKYIFEKFIDTAKIVLNRRNQQLSNEMINLYKFIFNNENNIETN